MTALDGASEETRARLRHDLKARLAVIVGYAELLRARDDEQIRRDGPKRIVEAAELLGREIDALFEEPGSAGAPGALGTIVIVDDDEQIRELLRLTIPEADFTVREASGGPETLRMIEAETPALVLLDWHMPARPGAEVLEELKRRWPDLPVVVLTAEQRQSERERADALGANAFLTKPFSPIELLETIERVVAQKPPDQAS